MSMQLKDILGSVLLKYYIIMSVSVAVESHVMNSGYKYKIRWKIPLT